MNKMRYAKLKFPPISSKFKQAKQIIRLNTYCTRITMSLGWLKPNIKKPKYLKKKHIIETKMH